MTWTTELPTEPGWYYRRVVKPSLEERYIVRIYSRRLSHEPVDLWMERLGEAYAEPVSGSVGYEFQLVNSLPK